MNEEKELINTLKKKYRNCQSLWSKKTNAYMD